MTIVSGLLRMARKHRRATTITVYASTVSFALSLAYLARWEFDAEVLTTWPFMTTLILFIGIRVVVNFTLRLGMGSWRFVSTKDFTRLFVALTTGSLLVWLLSWAIPAIPNVPRSILLLEWVFSGYLTGGLWVLYRLAYEHRRRRRQTGWTRVLVAGAGEAAQQLVHQMQRAGTGYVPVALVDDDPVKCGALIHGVEVVGDTSHIEAVARARHVEEVIIAIPSASPAELRQIVRECEASNLPLKLLPGIEDVLRGDADLGLVRDVRLEDLLGRDPITLELPELVEGLRGRTVLVTGAAGSIGSELVRQIARQGPARMILMDQAETPLYYLDLEVARVAPELSVVSVVGDVTNQSMVEGLFAEYAPDQVFHAAAYKHVPLMEHNEGAAVRTNVVGTFNVARSAGRFGAETFVLISTDKAVQPANIMGATKNLAEQIVLHMQDGFQGTDFGAVRFGNVLGSNGSVLPLFRRQLERGEPLTVTHEDVTRFFMTIPEAVQLVLQASLVSGIRGRVAMLDMGEPVRIMDLARDLLRLSGRPFRFGENVVIVGLRPGEKLHEKLRAPHEGMEETEVDRVHLIRLRESPTVGSPRVQDALGSSDIGTLLDWLYTVFPTLCRGERSMGRGRRRDPEPKRRHSNPDLRPQDRVHG